MKLKFLYKDMCRQHSAETQWVKIHPAVYSADDQ